MCSRCRGLSTAVAVWATLAVAMHASAPSAGGASAVTPLRVCADPNNMPFSNQHADGFENRIATLVAGALHRPLSYFWLPQRRGFIRNSLNAGQCDVVMGVPAQYGLLLPTHPYYRSSYVFVARRDRHVRIDSFDAPALRSLKIGIQISGDDYNNPPAAQALAVRQIIQNVRGFPVYGDYSKPDPQREIIDAVADGRVDVAVVWGPLAGYYARREPVAMEVIPVAAERDGPVSALAFDIAMGVRREDQALKRALDGIITRNGVEIRRILRSYGVPLR
jgi:mxaJ protein